MRNLRILVLFLSTLVISPESRGDEANELTYSNHWSVDATVSVSPFDKFDLGFGGNALFYFTDCLGIGLTGQVKTDSLDLVVETANFLEVELGIRLKYFLTGSIDDDGIVLSPNVVYIDWNDRNIPSNYEEFGARLGLDVSYEAYLSPIVFVGFGGGVGVYLKNPEIQFFNSVARWRSTVLLQLFGQMGLRF